MPDEAREVIFPEGIPLAAQGAQGAPTAPPPKPARREKDQARSDSDLKADTDDLAEQIEAFEDYVQSVDIASFNKL